MIGEYTTVNAIRSQYLGSARTVDDALLLGIIRQVSREINEITNRYFVPVINTRYYDIPTQNYRTTPDIQYSLDLDDDLLEVATFTNGDGSIITPSQYKLYPLNITPKFKIRLVPTFVQFQMDQSNTGMGALSVKGVWGFHEDYPSAWQYTTSASSAMTDTTGQSLTVPTGMIYAGDLIKLDDEFMYVASASAGMAADTLTVLRGQNGSTAAVHLAGAPVYRWTINDAFVKMTTQAAAAYYRLRDNPTGEPYTLDGVTYVTPRDVQQWLLRKLQGFGSINRLGIG